MEPTGIDLREALIQRRKKLAEYAGAETVVELVELFVARTPTLIESLRQGVRTAQVNQVRAAAHALKGSSSNIGAIPFSQTCAELEAQAREGKLDGAEQLISRIETEFAQVRAVLASLPPLPPEPPTAS